MLSERRVRTGLSALAALLVSGCMTLDSLSNPAYKGPRVYSGTRINGTMISRSLAVLNIPVALFHLMDFPFSFVADTLLLPITIPQESARVAEHAEETRTDVERPGPVAHQPRLSSERNAERFFEACARRFANLRPLATDCYSITARIVLGEQELGGQQRKEQLRLIFGELSGEGGYATLRDPHYTVEVEGKRVRIDATLIASFRTDRPRVQLVVELFDDGYWRIVEESGPAWPSAAAE